MLFSISSIPLHVDSHLKTQPLVLHIFVKICCRTEQVKKKKKESSAAVNYAETEVASSATALWLDSFSIDA